MKKCIILIGPPCSGKSTVGKMFAEKTRFKYVSSGDIARKMAEEDGTMDNLNAGGMAPEDRMRNEIVKIFSNGDDIILDGFPRFVEQYEWIMTKFFDYEFKFIVVDVPTLELFNRAVSRGRTDDIAIMERLEYYMKHTVPMIQNIRNVYGYGMHTVMNMDATTATRVIWEMLYDCGWVR